MKKNWLAFLYESSQQEEEMDSLLEDGLVALLEKADAEEAEGLKAEKTTLVSALKLIGVSTSALHEDPEGFALVTDDRETYMQACARLTDPDVMHALAVKGWVASNCGDQAMSNEEPEYKVRFLEIASAGSNGEDSEDENSAIMRKARAFATEEPDHDDNNQVSHEAPKGTKLTRVTIGKASDGAGPKGSIKDSVKDAVDDMLEDCGQPGSRLDLPKPGQKVRHTFKKLKGSDKRKP